MSVANLKRSLRTNITAPNGRGSGRNESPTTTDHRKAQLAAVPKDIKRLNVNLPTPVFRELEEIADSTGRSLTEIVRLGLGLVAIATDAEKSGHRLVVADRNGGMLRELILPK